jgi:hypothetical protein
MKGTVHKTKRCYLIFNTKLTIKYLNLWCYCSEIFQVCKQSMLESTVGSQKGVQFWSYSYFSDVSHTVFLQDLKLNFMGYVPNIQHALTERTVFKYILIK